MKNIDKNYTTFDEIHFINNLGKFSEKDTGDRKELLHKYFLGIEKRKNWGKVDKEKVMDHLRKIESQ